MKVHFQAARMRSESFLARRSEDGVPHGVSDDCLRTDNRIRTRTSSYRFARRNGLAANMAYDICNGAYYCQAQSSFLTARSWPLGKASTSRRRRQRTRTLAACDPATK